MERKMERSLFTTGEFAKFHKVNKRTLHYYDEIGLFKPKVMGDNGYRYYTYLQSSEFEMILAFRELGMSIEEIMEYFKNPNTELFRSIIQAKKAEIKNQIHKLRELDKLLQFKENQLDLSEAASFDKIEIIQCEEEYLLLSDTITGEWNDEDFKKLFAHTENCTNRIFNRSYGSMISVEALQNKKYEDYAYFFTQVSKSQGHKTMFKKPKGNYLRAFCKGDWNLLPDCYERILSFTESQKMRLTGYAYEEGINEMAISAMDEYITQITIRCEKD